MDKLLLILTLLAGTAYAVVNPTGKTHNVGNTVVCADGKRWTVCAPGNEVGGDTLLFSENFDSQPDWQTLNKNTVGTIPSGWDAARTDEEWHPANGDTGTQPSMLISGADSNKVYGGTGKSFITYSESNNALDDNGFESDGILEKDFTPTDELYIKFYIKFQPGWGSNPAVDVGQLKILRVGSFNGDEPNRHNYGTDGSTAPLYFYDWATNDYGLRQFHAYRCDAQESNYFCTSPTISGAPRQINSGDMSANYNTNVAALGAQIPDLVNGGYLDYVNLNYHDQVFGDEWHLLEFYFKLNSAAGVQDGIHQHWIDGEKIIDIQGVPWIGTGGDMNAKWNTFGIGGNDHFHFDLVGAPADRERWYAIDNIEVRNAKPEGLD